jgi:hypothetical protein
MAKFIVDGETWEILLKAKHPDGWLRIFARPLGSSLGPHRCFSVPSTVGAFRTSGHSFSF